MKKTEQEKAGYLMEKLGDVNACIRTCNYMIGASIDDYSKAFYQRVKQILIDKQK